MRFSPEVAVTEISEVPIAASGNKIHRVQRPAQWGHTTTNVFYGVGRGATTRVSLVPLTAYRLPLTALDASLLTVTSSTGFDWFVSWM